MIQRITKSMFRDAFERMNRKENFSYDGLGVLFEHLEEINQEIELDVIAICCEYTESTIGEALESYSLESLDDLESNTPVLLIDDSRTENSRIIYQQY